jgi:heat shock protein HslJ
MACEEANMAVEDRFLRILPGLQSFRFAPGMLMLAYTRPDGYGGELWFRAVAPP